MGHIWLHTIVYKKGRKFWMLMPGLLDQNLAPIPRCWAHGHTLHSTNPSPATFFPVFCTGRSPCRLLRGNIWAQVEPWHSWSPELCGGPVPQTRASPSSQKFKLATFLKVLHEYLFSLIKRNLGEFSHFHELAPNWTNAGLLEKQCHSLNVWKAGAVLWFLASREVSEEHSALGGRDTCS